MTGKLTHVDEGGKAAMVDVSDKPITARMARASGAIRMAAPTLRAIMDNTVKKGDVLGVARIAGIMAAKKTADLIPLCHPLTLTDVQISCLPDESLPGVRVEATARTVGPTGVEMEAILAATVTLITIFDMVKALDKGLELGQISVIEKHGGRSGDWPEP